jgi:hypothetical protein
MTMADVKGENGSPRNIPSKDAGLPAHALLYTTRRYPCACRAEGWGDVPNYCSEHDLPDELRNPLKAMEHGRMLNQFLDQRNVAWKEIERLRAALEKVVTCDFFQLRSIVREALRVSDETTCCANLTEGEGNAD